MPGLPCGMIWSELRYGRRPDLGEGLMVTIAVAAPTQIMIRALDIWRGGSPPETFTARPVCLEGQTPFQLVFHKPELLDDRNLATEADLLRYRSLTFRVERMDAIPA